MEAILAKRAKRSSHRNGDQRKYNDLVSKRFDMKVIRIERTVDKDDVANKWCDFSLETINNLFNQGERDAREYFVVAK